MTKNMAVLFRPEHTTELFGLRSIFQKGSDARRPPMCTDSIGHAEEAELVQRVFLLPVHEVPRVVVFCGVGPVDGAGAICARAGQNLASQTGSAVCVVEGDFHSSSLHQYFGVDNAQGLTDAVLESGPIRNFVHSLPGGNLSVLSGGSRCRDVQTLWKSERLRSRIAELRREFSYVLIYCPPVSQCADAVLLGQIADGVILILESMVTRRETARAAKENLASANVKILGAVLNNHSFSIPENLYRRL
jgi:protein-tyrosine kinase